MYNNENENGINKSDNNSVSNNVYGGYQGYNPYEQNLPQVPPQTSPQIPSQTVSYVSDVNYVPYEQPEVGKKSKRSKNKGNKKLRKLVFEIVAITAAVLIVATGSVIGYRYIDDNFLSDDGGNYSGEVSPNSNNNGESGAAIAPYSGGDAGEVLTLSDARENPLSAPEIYNKVITSTVGIESEFSNGVGMGTGIVMTADGYIITNAHVVENTYTTSQGFFGQSYQTQTENAKNITVTMSDEKTKYNAVLVGKDSESDIAVIKVEASDLVPAEFGDSTKLMVGEDVIAIGNPLSYDLFGTLTKGVVSALNRQVTINDKAMNLIQTDTAINSGNSGGPLINCYGQIIGINSAKMSSNYMSSGSASVEGLAFAIPISSAQSIINDLITNGYVTGRPKLGIVCQTYNSQSRTSEVISGAIVLSVTADGAADKSGVKIGDIVVGINDEKVTTAEEVIAIKNKYNAGDTITLNIIRDNRTMDIQVALDEVGKSQA
ncbi:MAG: trypsin-like peptidase domain-containing protein [Ruminococcus sp.]|jgi:serine protease Do|nr:trypsin-like peptidase domain-containing protein [Ruminococcus sp.]